jgi:hypothetical protein
MPADVAAMLIVPSLNETSRSITKAMEGMGRRELLLGARPIDHVKSITGVVQHVDDDGPFIVAWRPSSERRDGAGSFVVFISTADPAALLESNFTATDHEHVVEHSSGTRLHVRSFNDALLLSTSPLHADDATMGEQGVARMRSRLGDPANALLDNADAAIVTFGSGPWTAGIEALRARLESSFGASGRDGADLSMVLARLERFAGEFEASITAIEFDPLAVTVRSYSRFQKDSPLAPSSPTDAASNAAAHTGALSTLPRQPYLACGSIAFDAAGFEVFSYAARMLADINEAPSWLRAVSRADFAAYVSAAGPAAGALNAAAMVLATDEPARVRKSLKTRFSQTASPDDDASSSWDEMGSIEGAADVAAYRVERPQFAPDETFASIAYSALFGPAGWQGYVWASDDRVAITFSKRRDTIRLVQQGRQERTLADDAAIRTMRGMITHSRDLELYLSPSRIAPVVIDPLRRLPRINTSRLPDVDIRLPPVGFAADHDGMGLHTTTIVPADVVAVLLEAALQYQRAPQRPPSPTSTE